MWSSWWYNTYTLPKLEKLRQAETRLLEYARRHVMQGNAPSSVSSVSSTEEMTSITSIDVFDTKILRTSVPLKNHTYDYSYPNNSNTISSTTSPDHYIIHSVRVQQKIPTIKSNNNNIIDQISQSVLTKSSKSTESDTPLVILHGYMNGGAYFYRNLIGFSSYFTSIYALDMLGWGLSSRPDFSPANLQLDQISTSLDGTNNEKEVKKIQLVRAAEDFFVESLEAWRVANNINKFVLAGHSMGGYISVAYAERYPQNVEKLILISPVGVPDYNNDERLERQKRKQQMSTSTRTLFNVFESLFTSGYTPGSLFRSLPERTVYKLSKGYIERRLPLVTEQDEQVALTDYLLYNSVLPGSGEYCLDMLLNESVHAHDPLVYRINKLKEVTSAAFIYGEHDWMDPTAAVQVLLEQQQQKQTTDGPEIDVYIVRDSGHLLMLENWKEFNNALLQCTIQDYKVPLGTTQPKKVHSYDELAAVRRAPNFNIRRQQQQQVQQQEQEQPPPPLPQQAQ